MLNLLEVLRRIDELQEDDIVFLRREWMPESEAEIAKLKPDFHLPDEPLQRGLDYFLEVETIRLVLQEFDGRPEIEPRQKCARLIQYAINDA